MTGAGWREEELLGSVVSDAADEGELISFDRTRLDLIM